MNRARFALGDRYVVVGQSTLSKAPGADRFGPSIGRHPPAISLRGSEAYRILGGDAMSAQLQSTAVIGLRNVGLPLAREAVDRGLACVGFDTSFAVRQGLASGHSHVDGASDNNTGWLLDSGFQTSGDPPVLGAVDAVVIRVPAPLSTNGGSGLFAVESAALAIVQELSSSSHRLPRDAP